MQEVKNLYKYWEYIIKCRARGYYDYKSKTTFEEDNPTFNIEMKPYVMENVDVIEGIPYSINADCLILPYAWDYRGFLDKTKYVLMPYENGKEYKDIVDTGINLNLVESICTIDGQNQMTVTSSSQFYLKKEIPTLGTGEEMRMLFKLTVTSPSTSQVIAMDGSKWQAYVTSNLFCGYFGSRYDGKTTLEEGKTYWFGISQKDGYIKGYLIEDSRYTLETLPEYPTEWTEEWSRQVNSSYTMIGTKPYLFENNAGYNQPWLGSIDLNNCAMYLVSAEGEKTLWWKYGMLDEYTHPYTEFYYGCLDNDDGEAHTYNVFAKGDERLVLSTQHDISGHTYLGTLEVPKHDLYDYSEHTYRYYDQYTMNGTVEVSRDGEASGLTDSNYLTFDLPANFPTTTWWEMSVGFTVGTLGVAQFMLSTGGRYDNTGIYFAINAQNKINACVYSGGNNGVDSEDTVEEGQYYIAKMRFDGVDTYHVTVYKGHVGNTFFETDIKPSTMLSNKPTMYLGYAYMSGAKPFNGTINLADTYYKDGEGRQWLPYHEEEHGVYTKKVAL